MPNLILDNKRLSEVNRIVDALEQNKSLYKGIMNPDFDDGIFQQQRWVTIDGIECLISKDSILDMIDGERSRLEAQLLDIGVVYAHT